MTPVNAAITNHDPDKGIFGDCHRACLASILHLPLESVPHFMNGNAYGEHTDEIMAAQDEWLSKRGLSYIEFPIESPSLQQTLDWTARWTGDCHWILVAKSRNGLGHSVICKGNEIVHDPSYGDPHGIVGPLLDEETGNEFWWAMFITVK